MNYNELSYYQANPFYKQGYLPDRSLFNRQIKAQTSQIPSGKDFFYHNSRKHFKRNLITPKFRKKTCSKNRIAMDKTYMRSLQTIDIEGTSSDTRINQSIKNKLKARYELDLRFNQSFEINKNTEQQKRSQIALKHHQSYSKRGENKIYDENRMEQKRQSNFGSRSCVNKAEISEEQKRYIMQSSNNKFHKNKLIAEYPQHLRSENYTKNYQNLDVRKSSQLSSQNNQNKYQNREVQLQTILETNQQKQCSSVEQIFTSYYKNEFNNQEMRNSQQYQKILKYEEMSRRILSANLSLLFSLAGQNIVSNLQFITIQY